jgi:transposase-like protein
MINKKVSDKKGQIVSEYLTGTDSFNTLEEKYGVKARTIQTWVRAYRKKEGMLPENSVEDFKALKKQLLQMQLKNELLEEMLRLSVEQTGIDVRKKYGTKQS